MVRDDARCISGEAYIWLGHSRLTGAKRCYEHSVVRQQCPNWRALNDANLGADSRRQCEVPSLKKSDGKLTERSERLARAGHAFHHESRAAARDVRDDGGATMDFGDDA